MINKERPYQICNRCVMDTTDPDIIFDKNGVCNHCKKALEAMNRPPLSLNPNEKEKKLLEIIEEIKEKGREKKYDCIIGLSGGVDSTFTAYMVKKSGLKPLAVHLDNGWDSELAIKNIENIINKLGIDLFKYVIDWEEFKDLQMAFLKASTPDSEIPTDHAIVSILYKIARENNIKYILSGNNVRTEFILPEAWSYGHHDWKYINSLNNIFGLKKLKTFPHRSLFETLFDQKIRKIKWINILDYVDYIKKDAIEIIEKELKWRNYGGKHYESIYTRFFQGYILPVKFNYDKRKAHLASLIISGQLTRGEAISELEKDPYPSKELLEEDKKYFLNKFEITSKEFEEIMNLPKKTYWDYPSYQNSIIWKCLRKLYHIFY